MSCDNCSMRLYCTLPPNQERQLALIDAQRAERFEAERIKAATVEVGELYPGERFKGLVSRVEYLVIDQYIDKERIVAVDVDNGCVRTFERHAKVEKL